MSGARLTEPEGDVCHGLHAPRKLTPRGRLAPRAYEARGGGLTERLVPSVWYPQSGTLSEGLTWTLTPLRAVGARDEVVPREGKRERHTAEQSRK